MKKIYQFFVAILIATSLSSCGYNGAVELSEDVDKQWGQVQTAYQRRADLIPNLVNTVQGSANFEKETLTAVMEARAKATSMNVDASKLTPETMKEFQANQAKVSSALGRLMVSVEQYPQLKSSQNFLELQAQLEGTENRISVERNKFNEVTAAYNKHIKTFPENLYMSSFGFTPKPYFEAEETSQKAPEVKF